MPSQEGASKLIIQHEGWLRRLVAYFADVIVLAEACVDAEPAAELQSIIKVSRSADHQPSANC